MSLGWRVCQHCDSQTTPMELQENLLQLRLDQYDEKHYEQFTARSEADKAIHSLKGILTGISLDREINSSEVNELFAWTKIHYDLIFHISSTCIYF
jgi:hypothetical protein